MKKILTLLTLCILSTYARADIILKPTKTGEEHALLIIPGAGVKASQYEDLGKQIQLSFQGSMWVLIPSFLVNYRTLSKLKIK